MWRFLQKTGELFFDGDLIAVGYSGKGEGKNNPDMWRTHNVGPIPCGHYTIGKPRNSADHGPFVLPLSPHADNVMNGRGGFLIHGDSLAHPGEASEGCIIVGRPIRERIAASGVNEIEVVRGDG